MVHLLMAVLVVDAPASLRFVDCHEESEIRRLLSMEATPRPTHFDCRRDAVDIVVDGAALRTVNLAGVADKARGRTVALAAAEMWRVAVVPSPEPPSAPQSASQPDAIPVSQPVAPPSQLTTPSSQPHRPMVPPPANFRLWSPNGGNTIGPHNGITIGLQVGLDFLHTELLAVDVRYVRGFGDIVELSVGGKIGLFDVTPISLQLRLQLPTLGGVTFVLGVASSLQVLPGILGDGEASLQASIPVARHWSIDLAPFFGGAIAAQVNAFDLFGTDDDPNKGPEGLLFAGARLGFSYFSASGVGFFLVVEGRVPFAQGPKLAKDLASVPSVLGTFGIPIRW